MSELGGNESLKQWGAVGGACADTDYRKNWMLSTWVNHFCK